MRTMLMGGWLTLVAVAGLPLGGRAQELTTRDNDEVKLLARRKVELGLNDLLNVLSLADLGEAERNALISDSYAPGNNQLFASRETIVEDDVSPSRAAAGTVFDLSVDKYLANFDLLYAKSAASTVQFSDLAVTDLKKAGNLYVKVFFTSFFRGKHTKLEQPYGPVRRVAEVSATQQGTRWVVLITRLAFATPADSVNATRNNVALKEAAPRLRPAPTDSLATTRRDSAQSTVAVVAPPVDPEREREKAALLAYQALLQEGEKALAGNDLETAQRLFEKADSQKPLDDVTPRLRLFRIQKLLAEQTRNSLTEQKKQLDLAIRKRRYTEALTLLQRIASQQPDSVATDVRQKDLMSKARRRAELDERFSAGQYRDLVKEYGRLVDAERKLAKQTGDQTNLSDWLLGRGKSLTQLNEYKDALRDLNESLTLDFQNLEALDARANLYARLGDYPKAAADLSVYLTMDPTNAELLARRAGYRIRTNRPAEALADYEEALRVSNKNPRYYLLRGLLQQQTGACDKAETDFTEGTERSRSQPELFFRLGVAQTCLKKYLSAGGNFARAIELGLDPVYQVQIDSIATVFYQQSDYSVQERRYPEALSQLTTALQLKPSFAAAWLAKGRLHYTLQQYTLADSALTNAIRYNPTSGLGYYERGLTYLRQNQFAPAVADFRQATSLSGSLENALLGEARGLIGLRQYDQAQTTLARLISQRRQLEKRYPPTLFADAHYLSGKCAYELHQYEPALDQFEAALDLSKEWAAAYTERGRTYEALGKPDRARDDFNRAAQLEPTVADHQLPLALLLERRDKVGEALSAYSRCQELDHTNRLASAIALGKGRCLLASGKYLESLAELGRFGQYDGQPCTDECLYLRTYAQVRTGQLPTSTRLSGTLTRSTLPDMAPKLRYVLACAHLQADDDEQATAQLEKALQMGIAKDFLKKDPLLDFVRKDYRKTDAYTRLVSRYR